MPHTKPSDLKFQSCRLQQSIKKVKIFLRNDYDSQNTNSCLMKCKGRQFALLGLNLGNAEHF